MTIIYMIKNLLSKIVNIFKSDSNVITPTASTTLSTISTELSVKKESDIDNNHIISKLKEISQSINSTLYDDIVVTIKKAYLSNSKNVIYDIDGDNQITINDITTLTYFWNSINNPIDLSYYINSSTSYNNTITSYSNSYSDGNNDINYHECYGFYGRKINSCTFKSSGKTFPINYLIPKNTVIGTLKTYAGFSLPKTVSIVPGNSSGIVNLKNGNISLSKDTKMVQYGLGINATCTKISYYI